MLMNLLDNIGIERHFIFHFICIKSIQKDMLCIHLSMFLNMDTETEDKNHSLELQNRFRIRHRVGEGYIVTCYYLRAAGGCAQSKDGGGGGLGRGQAITLVAAGAGS